MNNALGLYEGKKVDAYIAGFLLFTKQGTNFLFLTVACFVTGAFLFSGNLVVALIGLLLFAGYIARNAYLGLKYIDIVVTGWFSVDGHPPLQEMRDMIDTPKAYEYEIVRGYELGKSLSDK